MALNKPFLDMARNLILLLAILVIMGISLGIPTFSGMFPAVVEGLTGVGEALSGARNVISGIRNAGSIGGAIRTGLAGEALYRGGEFVHHEAGVAAGRLTDAVDRHLWGSGGHPGDPSFSPDRKRLRRPAVLPPAFRGRKRDFGGDVLAHPSLPVDGIVSSQPLPQTSSIRKSYVMGSKSYRRRFRRSRRKRKLRLYKRVRRTLGGSVRKVNLVWQSPFSYTGTNTCGFGHRLWRPRLTGQGANWADNNSHAVSFDNNNLAPIGWNDLIKQYTHYSIFGMKVKVSGVIGMPEATQQPVQLVLMLNPSAGENNWSTGTGSPIIDGAAVTYANNFNYRHRPQFKLKEMLLPTNAATTVTSTNLSKRAFSMSRYFGVNELLGYKGTHENVDVDKAVPVASDPAISSSASWYFLSNVKGNYSHTVQGTVRMEFYITFLDPQYVGYGTL